MCVWREAEERGGARSVVERVRKLVEFSTLSIMRRVGGERRCLSL
nr:MAG TPA: hypothetical protein [Caudoviricetes sp.]